MMSTREIAEIDRLFGAWRKSSALHTLNAGAGERDIAALDASLTADAKHLYEITNGAELLGGNLTIYPLRDAELSLAQASCSYRSWGWPIPDQLLIIGNDGQGDPFGLWSPSLDQGVAAVVLVGQLFEPASLAVAATSLSRFLTIWTAYYSLLLKAPAAALDALGLPLELRAAPPDDHTWGKIVAWADPDRPGASGDPHEARMTAQEVDLVLRRGVPS